VRFLDDDERERLLAACRASDSPLLYPIVVLAMSTGMRKGEILALSWQQIDFAREHITLHQTKNGDSRGIPLTGLAFSLLRKLHEERHGRTDLVFPSPTVLKPILIAKAWTTALTGASIKQFRFHDLRHSAASYLVMNGASLPEVGDLLGHKTAQMTRRYAHFAQGHTRRIVAAMNDQIFSGHSA
jgi:integrase